MKPTKVIMAAVTVVLAALAGYFALIIASPTEVTIGPLRVEFALSPAWHGKSVVDLPPVGSIEADTHSGPAEANYALKEIAVSQVDELTDPSSPERQALVNWQEPVRREVNSLLARVGVLAATAGGVVAGLLRRRWQWALVGAVTGLGVAALVGGTVYGTYRTAAFEEPRYSGNLASAPEVLAFSQQTLANLDEFEGRVPEIAESLYRTVSELHQLPPAVSDSDTVKVLHISDMHSSAAAAGLVKRVVDLYGIDFVIDTGDTTDLGTPFEAGYPSTYLPLSVPYVWVAGNHDTPTIIRAMQEIPGVAVLDGEFVAFDGVTIAGFADPSSKSLSPEIAGDGRLAEEARRVAGIVSEKETPPFIAAVHDPAQAEQLAGRVPVVVHGHTHQESMTVRKGTVFLDGGSTGGGGLRSFERDGESPSSLHILYVEREPMRLIAADAITIFGFRQEFSVARRVFGAEEGSYSAIEQAGLPISSGPVQAGIMQPPMMLQLPEEPSKAGRLYR